MGSLKKTSREAAESSLRLAVQQAVQLAVQSAVQLAVRVRSSAGKEPRTPFQIFLCIHAGVFLALCEQLDAWLAAQLAVQLAAQPAAQLAPRPVRAARVARTLRAAQLAEEEATSCLHHPSLLNRKTTVSLKKSTLCIHLHSQLHSLFESQIKKKRLPRRCVMTPAA